MLRVKTNATASVNRLKNTFPYNCVKKARSFPYIYKTQCLVFDNQMIAVQEI